MLQEASFSSWPCLGVGRHMDKLYEVMCSKGNTEKGECKRLSHAEDFHTTGGLLRVLSRRRCKCLN